MHFRHAMKALSMFFAAILMACASAPATRAPTGGSPESAREAGEPPPVAPAADPVADEETAPPVESPVVETVETVAPAVTTASTEDCEKVIEKIDTVCLMAQTGTSVVAPNLHPGWHRARVRACTTTVDSRARDCLLGSGDLDSAKKCRSAFFTETARSYRVR